MARALSIILSILQWLILFGLCYHYGLLIASTIKTKPDSTGTPPQNTFAIVIPAHNESAILAQTLDQLKNQTYPRHLFKIHVVADHCQDDTAQVAREHGAISYIRDVEPRGRKAYALQWLLEKILAAPPCAAIVIFDADSYVDPRFLETMDQALGGPDTVLQGNHIIANSKDNLFSGLAAADMRLNNLLRNQAKQNLGLSCRLMGDAMCFQMKVIRQHGWPSNSLGEDREYGLYLLTQGIKVGYVREAKSYGQAAPNLKTASTQRVRWYGGVTEIQKSFALRLLKLAIHKRDVTALDQTIELLLPPFSLLAALTTIIVTGQGIWPWLRPSFSFTTSMAMLVAWIAFPLIGLAIDKAPSHIYKALLFSPFYIVWRLWAGLKARLLGKHVPWVRTQRREEVTIQKRRG